MYGQLLVVDLTGGTRAFQLERLTEARDAITEAFATYEADGVNYHLYNYSSYRLRAPKLQVVFLYKDAAQAVAVTWNTDVPEHRATVEFITEFCARYSVLVDGVLHVIKQYAAAVSCEFKPKDPDELVLDTGSFFESLSTPFIPPVPVE